MYGIATLSAAAVLLFTGRSGKPCQLLDHETVETRRSRSHYEFRRVRSMMAVSKYRFVVDLAHVGGGVGKKKKKNGFLLAVLNARGASREAQVASSGSPTTLFILEAALRLRNRIGCQRKLEVTYTRNKPCRSPHHWKRGRYVWILFFL